MTKHQQIRETLEASIRQGEYPASSRLPSERELAARFGVSYLTARRAVADLVDARLLERRARSGTYVREGGARRLAATTVNLICTTEDRTLNRSFLRIGARLLTERGWEAHPLRIHAEDDRAAARAVAEPGSLSVVVLEGVERIEERTPLLLEALRKAQGRAVLLANRMDQYGIPSVVADDPHALRMAVSHLREHGHRQIALLTDQPEHPVARVQIAAWRSACAADGEGTALSSEALLRRLIVVRPDSYDCLPTATYHAVRSFVGSGEGSSVTALISLLDEMCLPVLAALRDEGRVVPESFSLVSLGDSSLLSFTHPAVTCVDVDLESHLRLALEVLESARRGEWQEQDSLRLVEPRLVVRQSVGAAPSRP